MRVAGASVKVVFNKVPAIVARMPAARNQVMTQAGAKLVAEARRRSRVRSGRMRNGWAFTQVNKTTWQLYNPVPYTVFNEYGTRFMAAQPMARPAAELVAPWMFSELARTLVAA